MLLVLDGIKPEVLRAAIEAGETPNLAELASRGEALWDAVSVFPSITPAATAAIATGKAPAESGIVGHAWFDDIEASDHGSLHANDSNVFMLASGIEAPRRITDVAPTLLRHFGAGEPSIVEDKEFHVS